MMYYFKAFEVNLVKVARFIYCLNFPSSLVSGGVPFLTLPCTTFVDLIFWFELSVSADQRNWNVCLFDIMELSAYEEN